MSPYLASLQQQPFDALVMYELEILRNAREFLGGAQALSFWQTVTRLGDGGFLWISVGLYFLCFKPLRRTGCVIGVALFAGFILCNATLKPLFDRLRPCEMHPQDLIFSCPADPSFPSGHTTASFAAALALAFFHPRWGAAALSLAVLIAWSRLYLFVHWPTDVAAGILIGTMCATFAIFLVKRTFKPTTLSERSN